MPKTKGEDSPEQQVKRFRQAVQELVNAGELNAIEADAAFGNAMGGVAKLRQNWFDEGSAQEAPPAKPD